MLKIIKSLNELNIRQIMDLYEESNRKNGSVNYPHASMNLQIIYAEQDFYCFLLDFFSDQSAKYFVWTIGKTYISALRVEAYNDGLLLEALETAPSLRRQGYATTLLKAVIAYLSSAGNGILYSHVNKQNEASLAAHQTNGFTIISDNATYIDGSFHSDSYTLGLEY